MTPKPYAVRSLDFASRQTYTPLKQIFSGIWQFSCFYGTYVSAPVEERYQMTAKPQSIRQKPSI